MLSQADFLFLFSTIGTTSFFHQFINSKFQNVFLKSPLYVISKRSTRPVLIIIFLILFYNVGNFSKEELFEFASGK